MFKSLTLLALGATGALAGVVTKTWSIDWVNASPDGFARPVIGKKPPSLSLLFVVSFSLDC